MASLSPSTDSGVADAFAALSPEEQEQQRQQWRDELAKVRGAGAGGSVRLSPEEQEQEWQQWRDELAKVRGAGADGGVGLTPDFLRSRSRSSSGEEY